MPRKPLKPFARSYWVVPGKLLAGCYPGDKDPVEAALNLNGLLDCGIRCVVSLMEGHETDHSGDRFVAYEEPLTKMAQARILDTVDDATSRGLPVYVHCWGGVGRTGTAVGCYLARHGRR